MKPEKPRSDLPGEVLDAYSAITIGVILGFLVCLAVAMMGCASMLKPIPGRTKLGDCSWGTAYIYRDQILCDRPDLTTFHAYKWTTLDLPSACRECRGWAW